MKKACPVCLTNCLRLHGAQEEDEDVTACLLCASRKPEEDEHVRAIQNSGKLQEDEHVQADRNPSFLKKMAKSTMNTLKLPLSFVRDQIERLDGSVILEGPSKGKWRVELQGSFQSFSFNFGQGWEKFVADHVLQIDDLLTFSLSAKSYFQVEVYDGGGCQKTSALDATQSAAEVAEAARSKGVDDPEGVIKLAKSDQGGLLPEHHVVRGNVLSRRRFVTELEKERAFQAAEALELANPNTLMVMSKGNVYKGFWLGISKQFAKEWMPSGTKEVTLVNKGGHSWLAKWIAARGGLSGGWRRFSLDHHLEEHDVCVFELIDKTNCVLLVHIFRVLWCPGEDPGLYTPALTPDKENKRKSSNGHEADGTPAEGSERKSKRSRRDVQVPPDGTPDDTPGEGSERKNKRSRRDVQVNKHTLEPDSATKSLQRKSRLLGDDKSSPAKRKELVSPNHEEIGTSDRELLMHIIQKSVDQVSPENRAGNGAGDEAALRAGSGAEDQVILRAGGAGDEVALRAGSGAGDQVENRTGDADVGGEDRTPPRAAEGTPTAPQQVLTLLCCDYGKTLAKKNADYLLMRNGYRCAERPSSARADVFPAVHGVNPDEVHGQIVHAPGTGPFRGRKVEKRQAYKVVHIYKGRNVGNGTEFLAELEGFSESQSFATLDRDDDTGFWWVPSEQFGWDMLHCYIG